MSKLFYSLLCCFIILIPLVGVSQNLSLEWKNDFLGPGTTELGLLTKDKWGNLIVGGRYEDTLFINTATADTVLTSQATFLNSYVAKYDSNGNLLWAVNLDENIIGGGVQVTPDGNIFVSGTFEYTVDFDPGPGVDTFTARGSTDMFGYFCSFDPNGNYRFKKIIESTGWVRFGINHIDEYGNIYASGTCRDSTDLDPDPLDTFIVTTDNFFAKYDSLGQFISGGGIEGSVSFGSKIGPDHSRYFFGRLSGSNNDSIDLDPGLGTHWVYPSTSDAFISKIDSAGNFVWGHSFGGVSGADIVLDIAISSNNNIYLYGYFSDTVDFDFGSGTYYQAVSGSSYEPFIFKIDENSAFQWVKIFPDASGLSPSGGVEVDANENIYFALKFINNSADLDPGPGVVYPDNRYPANALTAVLLRFNKDGDYVWSATCSAPGYGPNIADVKMIDDELYLQGSGSDTIVMVSDSSLILQFVPGYTYDSYLARFSQNPCASFTMIYDSAYDVNCSQSGFASVTAQDGHPPYTYIWAPPLNITGSDAVIDSAGIYWASVSDVAGCERHRGVLINGPLPDHSDFDLVLNSVSSWVRPGVITNITMNIENRGCNTVSGELIVVLDSLLGYSGASPVPDYVNGDTIKWNYTDLMYDSANVIVNLAVLPDTSLIAGDLVCYEAFVLPLAGDVDTSNNIKQYCSPVVNSYDPNDKQVYPLGECQNNYVLKDDRLTYTIRFQNTGNANANNVFVLDTLSSALDISTARLVSSSHHLTVTELPDTNVLKFRFDNINLPDSSANESASHGYLMFDILPKTGVLNGTVVSNSAGIYFDFNAPIITNTVSNTLVDSIPVIDASVATVGDSLVCNMAGAHYQWMSCDSGGTTIVSATDQVFEPADSGYYAVLVESNSCSKLSECVYFRHASPTDTTGIGVVQFITQVSVYPNPTTGSFTVDLGKSRSKISVVVKDIAGRTITNEQKENVSSVRLDMDAAPGMYFVIVTNASGETARLKILKQ